MEFTIDKKRIYAYIDNFNFYHSIKSYKNIKWINWEKLIEYIIFEKLKGENRYSIELIKYFTSEVPDGTEEITEKNDYRKRWERQQTYWKAIEAYTPNVEMIKGRFIKEDKARYFNKEGGYKKRTSSYLEKETDVNIACHILNDAHKGKYDTALIISGDGDIVPALKMIKEEYKKEVIVAFPSREGASSEMDNIADDKTYIGTHLKDCLLPDPVITKEGEELKNPWRKGKQ